MTRRRPTAAECHEHPSTQSCPLSRQARAQLHRAAERACGPDGQRADIVLKVLACRDPVVSSFPAWFVDREHAAEQDRLHGGCPCGSGNGERWDGVPLSTAQRLAAEIPLLIEQLKADPVEVLESVNRGRGVDKW